MSKLTESLHKKVFGIPISYLALLAVAGLGYYAYKLKSDTSTSDSTTPDPTVTDGDTSAASDAADTGDSIDFSANPAPTYSTDTSASTTVATNDSWVSNGVTWAVAQNLGTAGDVQSALQAYLNGAQLSYDQGAIRDAVIKQFGPPPDLPQSGGTSAAPAKRQGNPPTYHTVQGTTDNSYTALARLYYGNQTGAIDLLQLNNQKLPSEGPFPKGTRIFIPRYTAPAYVTAKKGLQSLHDFAVKSHKTSAEIQELNSSKKFPVKIGTRVRVA